MCGTLGLSPSTANINKEERRKRERKTKREREREEGWKEGWKVASYF
jgi:hypothetical protein